MSTDKPRGAPTGNADNAAQALRFIERLIVARVSHADPADPKAWPSLAFFNDGSAFGELIRSRAPSFDEYTVLALALAPHLRPAFLDETFRDVLGGSGDHPEVGGQRDAESRALMPTGETALYLIAGDDLATRFEVQRVFSSDHWFAREALLRLEPPKEGAPGMSGRILMASEWVDRLTTGHAEAPSFGAAFPARRIETALDWDDLVLPEPTRAQLEELLRWVEHRAALAADWGFGARLRPGYRALFHGSSGTGKTFAATLLGKSTGHPVYRIDLSGVVSKYVGETEKNLSSLFAAAHRRDWILFFDEADALFGKRTAVKDSHDRYANQEVSYLLQRVEEYDGLVILASNLRANIDDAFLRRFNAIIRFPEPGPDERTAIWRSALPARGEPAAREGLIGAVKGYELTGGGIVNVAQFAAIEAIAAGRNNLALRDLELGVRREIEKEGKVFRQLNPRGRPGR